MVLALIFALALISCSSYELNNPNDPRNYKDVDNSSGSSESSSSLAYYSSSSGGSSSSSELLSSSSNVVSSSSSELLSSSSNVVSSSSSELLSSSSSSEESSSECTAADNDETQYCSNGTMKEYGYFTYSSQTYKTVEIGKQTWMAENLNYNASGSVCYDGNNANCATYGRLYNWATAMALPNCNSSTCSGSVQSKHQGICPSGWHIPISDEWDTLVDYVEGSSNSNMAGLYLKAVSGWNDSGNGTDSYGFAALPGGYYGISDGSFSFVGNYGYWWSASEASANGAYRRRMSYNSDGADYNSNYTKSQLFSVRCVKND